MPAFRACPVVVEGSACKLFILSIRADFLAAGLWEIDFTGAGVGSCSADH
jgi:hypothetical protein